GWSRLEKGKVTFESGVAGHVCCLEREQPTFGSLGGSMLRLMYGVGRLTFSAWEAHVWCVKKVPNVTCLAWRLKRDLLCMWAALFLT
ncbi:hypothetical protein PIB30_090476, partial [Stylosanthes scabra]|nr:hypothetical protein [Stylosanthes scabra]